MAEYINKDDIPCVMYDDGSVDILLNKERLDNLPTIDIVHCEECEWWRSNLHTMFKHYGVCTNTLCCNSAITEASFFCGDGERKE